LCEDIVARVPAPRGEPEAPLTALIFDSHYDPYRGVVVHVRIFDGTLRVGQRIRFMSTGSVHEVEEVGIFRLALVKAPSLGPGEVGYFLANVKTVAGPVRRPWRASAT
jgi:GTP-binding protein LepA